MRLTILPSARACTTASVRRSPGWKLRSRWVSSVALAPCNDLRYQPSFLLRGLERLQLRLVPADASQ